MPSKTALSDRRALGNITNNGNIHTTSKPQQISVRRSENNGLRSQSSTALADTKQNTVIDNERNTRIESLVQGGVECSAGPTWEEQQVLQELGSADTLKYAVSAYNNMIQTHVSKLCEDLGEDTSGTEARRMIVREVMAMQNRESCVDIPNASSLSRKKTSTSELDIYCSDDDDLGSSELP
ncbi:hypothetical protein M9434_006849 [Picochlorum sp. BPE23]|nr:hypothetical protein M9434_006849 [Picochlorum sp. BPE23]